MRNFGIPEPHKPRIDPSEFDDPFFGGEDKPSKPNVYMQLGDERKDQNEPEEQKQVVPTELSAREIGDIFSNIGQKMEKDPYCELTQQEASLIYQVDYDLPIDERADEKYRGWIRLSANGIILKRGCYAFEKTTDTEIRQFRDFEQVKSLIIERLRSEKNVIETSTALLEVAEGLGLDSVEYNPNLYMQTLLEKMKDWEERGVFDYLTIELIKNNNRHNIVSVPNSPDIGEEQIVALAKKFGEGQPSRTRVTDTANSLFGHHYFDAENHLISGYSADVGNIRLSLMPTKFKFEKGIPVKHRTMLLILQTRQPEIKLHIPCLLEAVAHWYILRAQGDKLNDDSAFNKTYVRQIDRQTLQVTESYFPFSFVANGDGMPILSMHLARQTDATRVAAG